MPERPIYVVVASREIGFFPCFMAWHPRLTNGPGHKMFWPVPIGQVAPGKTDEHRARFTALIVRSETAKGSHKGVDLAGRRGFAVFKIVLDA